MRATTLQCIRGLLDAFWISGGAANDAVLMYWRGKEPEHLQLWRRTLQLTVYAAGVWLPVYVATEVFFRFLDPSNPPHSITYGIRGVLAIIATSVPVFLAVFSFFVSTTFQAVRPATFMTRRWRRVFFALLLLSLGVSVLLGCLLYGEFFLSRHHALLFFARVVVLCTLNATCMTVPVMLLEDYTVLAGIGRSVALTCRSPRSFCYPLLSYIILNAAWMGPLAFYWPPPVAVLLLTWMATSWNMILLSMLWERLVVEYDIGKSNSAVVHDATPGASALRKTGRRAASPAILFMLAVIVSLDSIRDSPLAMEAAPSQPKVLYHKARTDLSGAQSLEMLLQNAYAHHKGATYGGACVKGNFTRHHIKAKALIDDLSSLGVQKFLKFGCPAGGLDDPSIVWGHLAWFMGKISITKEWLESIRSQISYPEKPSNVFKIAAHIRRGDISPCTGDKIHKYLPNSYYLDMIDKYLPLASSPEHMHKTVEVVIHCMDISFEPLDVFRDRNYTIKLSETPLADVWTELMTADVFIMSQSGFSVVPALLNRDGIVAFAPYLFFDKAPGWESIDVRELKRYKQEVFDFLPECERTGRIKRFREGKSGVWFLLRNFGGDGFRTFFKPN